MPSTNQPLLEKVEQDNPGLVFESGNGFEWNPSTKTIIYDLSDPHFDARLLHELSHALLDHHRYTRDIDLIAMERDAWRHARMELGPQFEVRVDGDIIHHDMDTYRDWLHERSTCPKCTSTGLETKKHLYRCLTCSHTWRVNEARTCALRRYDATA
jgi:hypothetical protein